MGPRFGAHMSAAGGPHHAVMRAQEVGCETMALFSASPRIWNRPLVDEGMVDEFRDALNKTDITPVIFHALYLANPATPDVHLRNRTVSALVREMTWCETLGIPRMVLHPGSHMGSGETEGIRRVAECLDTMIETSNSEDVIIDLETTAGSGYSLGGKIEHIRDIVAESRYPQRVGICLDTCHLFAAGYDFSSEYAYKDLMTTLHRIVGMDRIGVIHLNDSITPLGSHVDRHTHIGEGTIGLMGFEQLVNDSRLHHVPMILETPKDKNGDWDRRNLAILRSLVN